jgi:hypothetical protein
MTQQLRVLESLVFFITLFNRREVALAHINQPIKHKLSRTMHFKLVMETKNICYLKKEDNADIVAVLQPLSGEMANNLKRNYSEKNTVTLFSMESEYSRLRTSF